MSTKKINDITYRVISNESDFEDYLLKTNSIYYDTSNNYILESNINWNNIDPPLRTTIKDFSGIFDGNKYGIYNFGNITDNISCGLFQSTSDAVIKNLILNVEGQLIGFNYVACLIGYASNTTISDCHITGKVNITSTGEYIGILSSYLFKCNVSNITINVTGSYLQGNKYIGGLCGIAQDTIIKKSIVCGELIILGVNYEYYVDTEKKVVYPQEIGGLIGSTTNCRIEDSQVVFVGSITGLYYISGFVPMDLNSVFKNCSMEVDGVISGFPKFVSLFCNFTKNLTSESSVFYKCKIGINSILNNVFVNIKNINEYAQISNTPYKLTFKDSIYPKSFYEMLKVKTELLSKENIIYNLFDYLLTYKQLEKLKISSLLLETETDVLLRLKTTFSNKWSNLSNDNKLLFISIGFNYDSFDIVEFPNKEWNIFTKKEKINAFKLGFNKKIWDDKQVQKIMNTEIEFIPSQTNLRQILSFRIEIPNMILKFPDFVKNLILIEVKDFLINRLVGSYINNSNNIKIFLTDKESLDILVILDNNSFVVDDKDDIDCIPELLQENIEIINEINKKEIEDLIPVKPNTPEPVVEKIPYSIKIENPDFGEPINYFNVNASLIGNITINNTLPISDDILLIYVNGELRGKEIIKINSGKGWVNTKIFTSNYFEVIQFKVYQKLTSLIFNVPDLQLILKPGEIFGSSTEPILINAKGQNPPDIISVTKENFGEPTIYYKKVASIYSTVIVNYDYAELGDVLAIYVGTQLRGKIKIQIINRVAIADGIIYSSGITEPIRCVIYSKKYKANFKVPNFTPKIEPGCIIGTDIDPVSIQALGNVSVDLCKILFLHQPKLDIECCEIGCNTIETSYNPVVDIECSNNSSCVTGCNCCNICSNCCCNNCNTCCNSCNTCCNSCNNNTSEESSDSSSSDIDSENNICDIQPCQNGVLSYYSALKLMGRNKENKLRSCVGGSVSGMGVNNVSGF